MAEPARKPLASMPTPPSRQLPAPASVPESKEPWTIRFLPSVRAAITEAARQRGLDPSTFAADLSLMGLMIVSTPALMEAHMRALSVQRAAVAAVANGSA